MSAIEFDTGPLSWVMGEIREALGRSQTALQEAAQRGAEAQATALQHAKTHLHQAHGALQMVDVEGVSRMTQAAEEAIDRFKAGTLACYAQHVRQVVDAYQAVVEYLEELLSGAAPQPARLFPYYRALLEMLKAERIHPADLFFADLSAPAPLPPPDAVESPDYAAYRARFEKSLLPFLKSADAAGQMQHAAGLQDAIAAVARAQAAPRAQAFWLAMQSFAELVASGQLASDLYVKQLFGLINLQMRRLSQGQADLPEAMLRDALFFVAAAPRPSATAQLLRSAYRLDGVVPADYATRRYGLVDAGALTKAREALAQAKASWSRIASSDSDAEAEAAFERALAPLEEAGAALGVEPLARLVRELAWVARDSIESGRGEQMGLELATGLLFLEQGLDQIRRLPDDFEEHAEIVGGRLLALAAGETPPEAPQWQSELSRQIEQGQTVAVLAGEIKAGLRQVEKVLDDYYADPAKRAALEQIVPVLHQLQGALAILDQDDAARAAAHVRESVQALAAGSGDTASEAPALQNIAQNVGALGFFTDLLAQNVEAARRRFVFDDAERMFGAAPLEQGAAVHADADGAGAASGESAFDVEMGAEAGHAGLEFADGRASAATDAGLDIDAVDAPDFAAAGQRDAADMLGSGRRDAADTSGSGPRGAIDLLGSSPRHAADDVAAEQRDAAGVGASEDAVDAFAAAVDGFVAAHSPGAPTVPPEAAASTPAAASASAPASGPAPAASGDDAAIEAELLEIFISEAQEVLEFVRTTLPSAHADPSNQDLLTMLRRSFHTLKGSGRMVGLTQFADGAAAIERVMNLWLSEARSATPDLLALLDSATADMTAWVDELAARGSSARNSEALIAAAAAVQDGGAFPGLPTDAGGLIDTAETPASALADADLAELEAALLSQAAPILPATMPPLPEFDLVTEDAAEADFDALPELELSAEAPAVIESSASPEPGLGAEAPEAIELSALPELELNAEASDTIELSALPELELSAEASEAIELSAPSELDFALEAATVDVSAADDSVAPPELDLPADAPQAEALAMPAEPSADADMTLDFPFDLAPPAESGGAGLAIATADLDLPAEPSLDLVPPNEAADEDLAFDMALDLELAAPTQSDQDAGAASAGAPEASELLEEAPLFAELASPEDGPQREEPGQRDDARIEDIEDIEAIEVIEAIEAIEAPVLASNVIEFPTTLQPAAPLDDNIRRIGELEIALPLLNIYLAETDELVRVLTRDFGEWRHEPHRAVTREALHAAHTLTGTSGTVGFKSLRALAYALEMALTALLPPAPALSDDQHDLIEAAVEKIRAMLQSFAQGELAPPEPEWIAHLQALREDLSTQRPAAPAPDMRDDEIPAFDEDAGEPAEAIADLPEELAEPHRASPGELAAQLPMSADEEDAPHGAAAPPNLEALLDLLGGGADASPAHAQSSASTPSSADAPMPDTDIAAETTPSADLTVEAMPSADVPMAEADVQAEATPSADAPMQEADIAAEATPLAGDMIDELDFEPSNELAGPASGAIGDLDGAELAPEHSTPDHDAPHDVAAPVASPVAPASAPAEELALAAALSDDLDPDLLPVFLEEGNDLLPEIGQALRAWQHNPADTGQAQMLLRSLHTVKGSARMAGAMRLGQHTHEIETQVENMLHAGTTTPGAFDELMANYDHALLLFEQLQQPTAVAAPAPLAAAQPAAQTIAAPAEKSIEEAHAAVSKAPLVRVRADILDRLVNQAGEISIARSKLDTQVGSLKAALSDFSENLASLRRHLREVEMQAESQIASRMSVSSEREFDPLEFDRFTRLQELTRMMAESVSDVVSFHESLSRTVDNAGDDLLQQARMTRDLQRDLMRVRMVPFASISERLFRVARQSAKELDKRVNVDIRGGAVDIDRSVLEQMAAPFEHLLRNAIVHGVEPRAARAAKGKSETGELLIQASQQGNEVVIEFSDDGAGLDLERIRAKARSNGLLAADAVISDAEAADLIFEPGFSTADSLTELAGRGVGMDVVRSEAQALGGRVAIASEPGKGARFTIHLPLTLAVTQVVLTESGGTTYALPSVLVEQVLQLKEGAVNAAHADGKLPYQGHQLALHYLPTLLGDAHARPLEQRSCPVLMLKSGADRLALHVDAVLGNREVVIKNVGPQLARMTGIAGATVLGSGEIVLILNPVALAHHLDHHPELRTRFAGAAAKPAAPTTSDYTIMVVDDSLTVRRVTQRLLEREGYHVVLAKDGVDALEQLQHGVPDLMLVDIEMPRMDGYDLTRNVRNDERTRAVPIIMITSRTADKHRNYALDLGVNAYFGKPFQEPILLAAISGLVTHETPSV